jgi:predicted lysophospholipase L1 biosynthesis ABC-type transport system permease subunit
VNDPAKKITAHLHILFYLAAAALLLLSIPYTIIVAVFALPASICNLMLALTVITALAGWRAECRTKEKRKNALRLEVDNFERHLWHTDN